MGDVDPVDAVSTAYDRLAHRWDAFADAVTPALRERYVEWLEGRFTSRAKVVELGSGTGHPVASALADRHDYLGVDSSGEMVAVATRNVPGARFEVADMRELDLPTGEIDAVVAFYSIIHVPRTDQPSLFAKIRRWLRPGGYFVGCLSATDLPAGEDADWLGAGPMFWSGYDGDTYRQLLASAGFEIVEASVIPQMEGDEEVRFLWVKAHATRMDGPAFRSGATH